jgi:hypothetical protein
MRKVMLVEDCKSYTGLKREDMEEMEISEEQALEIARTFPMFGSKVTPISVSCVI